METKGEGCNVILNTVNGPDICTSIRCLAVHGRFVQLLRADLTTNRNMGKTNEILGFCYEEPCLEFTSSSSSSFIHLPYNPYKVVKQPREYRNPQVT
jgi:hypothetical protein